MRSFSASDRVRRRTFTLLLFALAELLATGCGHLGAQPWERDLLAAPDMRIGADRIDIQVDDHIYFSKEASSGGRGIGGGGCGCN